MGKEEVEDFIQDLKELKQFKLECSKIKHTEYYLKQWMDQGQGEKEIRSKYAEYEQSLAEQEKKKGKREEKEAKVDDGNENTNEHTNDNETEKEQNDSKTSSFKIAMF